MQRSPDSALQTLLSFRAERGTSFDFNNNYQSLLISEALYKTDNAQLNRYRNETFQETSLQDAIRCFDSLYACYPTNDGLAMLSARSHYMNGVGFYENDSMVEACKEYLHTLEIMENHFDEKELVGYKAKFMGLTYNRLAELFSDKFITESTIYCIKKSIYYCKTAPTSKYALANLFTKLGTQYSIMGQNDSAFNCYYTAIEHLPDLDNIIYRDIVSHLAVLNYDLEGCASKAIDSLNSIIKSTNNYDETITRHMTLGYFYYKEGLYDNAIVYLKNVFENKANTITRVQSAEYLRDIYKMLGDTLNSNTYEKYLAEHTVAQYDNMKEVSVIDKLFNDYLNWQKHKLQYHKQKNTIHLTIVCLIFVAIIVFFIIVRKNKIIKDSGIKYDKEKARVFKLKEQLVQKRSKTELCLDAFLNEPVCRKICNMICDIPASARSNYSDYPNIKLDDNTVVCLGAAVTKYFPNLKNRLVANDINLKKDDLLLIYLYLLGLNISQIALLRQRSFSTIFRQSERLKKSFKGCKDLPTYIKNIAVS